LLLAEKNDSHTRQKKKHELLDWKVNVVFSFSESFMLKLQFPFVFCLIWSTGMCAVHSTVWRFASVCNLKYLHSEI